MGKHDFITYTLLYLKSNYSGRTAIFEVESDLFLCSICGFCDLFYLRSIVHAKAFTFSTLAKEFTANCQELTMNLKTVYNMLTCSEGEKRWWSSDTAETAAFSSAFTTINQDLKNENCFNSTSVSEIT